MLTSRKFYLAVFFSFLIGLTSAYPVSVLSLTALNESEMSDVTGQQGIILDFQSSSGIEFPKIDYTDADGADGTSGTLRLKTVCLVEGVSCGNAIDIYGLTLDSSTDLSIDGTKRAGMVIGVPTMNNNTSLTIDKIYPGSPGTSSLGSLDITAGSIQYTDLYLGAKGGNGFAGKIDLDLKLSKINFQDSNGYASGSNVAGDLRIEDIYINDGTRSVNNPTTLDGLTVDSSSSVFSSGSTAGVVVGMPSGKVSITTGDIHPGDPNATPITSGVELNGLDMHNTKIEVGAN
ncbi:MAG: DUF6160 family protein [bacterium]